MQQNDHLRDLFPEGFLKRGTVRSVPDGKCLVRQGSHMDTFYLITNGKCGISCDLSNGKTILIRTAHAPCLIGEMELLNDEPAMMTVRAIGECSLLAFDMKEARRILCADHAFLQKLSVLTIRKEHENAVKLICAEAYPLADRLAFFILEHCRGSVFRVKKTEIADSLGASYRHIEKLMDDFVKQGVLQKERCTYLIRDEAKLRELSDGLSELMQRETELE
ncbi:MAG: cyclic nucleotide-binding domain-containing protein [Stecheria intestinalis]|jgi:CRP/FNR family putative post-exponential-phase nitrogen-starvation transcriptional regulator|nr:cyclic nucleotide-binding domain-containing protein [Anaerolactibacter massiliensis]MDD6365541.1 cyclic nucleotide-binding domain-containing protein [Stecheria intestinalis]